MTTGDLICREHGVVRHALVHEAGHAVAALDFGIVFKDITIAEPGTWLSELDGGLVLGGVNMLSDDPASWVLPDQVSALRFVLAGSLSESEVLGHFLPDGYTGDQRVWRIGLGEMGPVTPDRFDQLAGGSARAIVEQVIICSARRTPSWHR